MFTGIIEEKGKVRRIDLAHQGARIEITAPRIAPTLKIGDSIAVNGVCLTVTRQGPTSFVCDLSEETLGRTSLMRAREGASANLERPLEVGSRLGGHFVQGHVDGVGRMMESRASGEGRWFRFQYPAELQRYLVFKGSIAVDGISLTIAGLEPTSFEVAIIPHTLEMTNLAELNPGDLVNLEVDILGKYFERFMSLGLTAVPQDRMTMERLKEEGF